MTELISVAEAEALVAQHMPRFGSERVALERAAGRLLRQAVHAEHDHPPFDRVMMDGIAVRWHDPLPREFQLAGTQLAGMAAQSLDSGGACLEVTTGAVLPGGCDCVIPVEQTRREGARYLLLDGCRPARGQFVHARGADCPAGSLLLEAGMRIGAPEMALLAANGVVEVEVAAVPSVAIVSTGDELVAVDAPLGQGQIRRSNDVAILAALRLHGFDRIVRHHVADDGPATRALLADLLAAHDVLILSGGVSVGQRDYVPESLDALGVRRVFHRIAQKPGKPMWFGAGPRGQVVFALPGNPVSALVCTIRYARPALLASMGMAAGQPEQVRLDGPVDASELLTCFVPAHVHSDAQGSMIAHAVPSRTSGDFSALPRTHGVVQLPPGQATAAAGDVVAFYRW
ncbi:molybdopterin molybdotransferase MoeA [Dyella soli]|nr:molybdopterin molybdotransferase MoeA [Dyella soli]